MHADASRRRVLVVDDSKFVRTTFRSILSGTFSVLEEADGESAWEVLSRDPGVVMVFTDLDMPRLDGFGLLARIRGSSDARVRTMPVAIITGDEQAATKKRAREAGASSFISKSADAQEVLVRIERLLRMIPHSQARPAPPEPAHGILSARRLMAEGQRHYALARRSGRDLSVLALRVDTHAELARTAGEAVAEQLLGQIGKVVAGALRSSDVLGRTASDTFVLLAPGVPASQLEAVARRLREQLAAAQVGLRGRPLRIGCSFGLASAVADARAVSVEELIGLARQRLKPQGAHAAARGLGEDVEQALRVLERATPSAALLDRLIAIAKALKAAQQ
jgi:diguanylate cyclase (GGDEF)-like protein